MRAWSAAPVIADAPVSREERDDKAGIMGPPGWMEVPGGEGISGSPASVSVTSKANEEDAAAAILRRDVP